MFVNILSPKTLQCVAKRPYSTVNQRLNTSETYTYLFGKII